MQTGSLEQTRHYQWLNGAVQSPLNAGRNLPPRDYVIALLAILFACFGYFIPKPLGSDWVASSRAALTFSVVEHRTINIDAYHEHTGDKAFVDGHYYTVASPGPSLIAVPVYAAFDILFDRTFIQRFSWHYAPGRSEEIARGNMALAFITFVVVSIPSALLATMLIGVASRLKVPPSHGFVVALVYALGTVAFPYSRAFYQHQIAAFCSVAGGLLLWERGRSGSAWVPAAAGALFAQALISEYSSVLISLPVLLSLRSRLGGRKAVVLLAAGGAVPLTAALAYNLAAFGDVTSVGYHYHLSHTVHQRGILGVGFPSWSRLYGLTFGTFRGLFFQSPVLLLAGYGLRMLWRERQTRALAAVCTTVFVSVLLLTASYEFWWGGSALGPRFLVSALPFLCVGLLPVWREWWPRPKGRFALIVLGTMSIVNVWVLSITGENYPPNTCDNPLWEHALPLFVGGQIAPNYGHWLGLDGWVSVVPLAMWIAAVFGVLMVRKHSLERERANLRPFP